MTVSASKPFKRDISLFVEAGGYTFTKAGKHEIWTTFKASKKRFLRSNRIEVYVKPETPFDVNYRKLRHEMTRPSHARLFYFRRPSRCRLELQRLDKFLKTCSIPSVRSGVRYALGRAEAWAATRTKSNARTQGLVESSVKNLDQVVESREQTPHRRLKAENMIANLTNQIFDS